MFLKMFFLSLISVTQISYAEVVSGSTTECETQINCTVSAATSPQRGTTSTTTQNAGTTPTQISYSNLGAAGTGAYTQARDAQNTANSTASAAATAAAGFWATCATRRGDWACPIAAALSAAAQNASNKAGEAGTFMRSLGTDGSTQGGTGTTTTPVDRELQTKIGKLKSDLANKGYLIDANGKITLPNGSTVDGDLNQQSLMASGMSQSEADQITQGLAQAKQNLQDKLGERGVESSGAFAKSGNSSGFGRVSISSLDGSEKETAKAVEAERTGIDRDPAAWEGFYKKFGNSIIGVSHSDIFLMVEKRVEKERQGMGN